MGYEHKEFSLSRIKWSGFDSRFNNFYQLYNESAVTKLATLINDGSLAGLFDRENLGTFLLRLSAYPLNELNFTSTWRDNIITSDENAYPVKNRGLYRFRYFDMGIYHWVTEGTYRDYSPYTTIKVWLPYYGYAQIDPKDIANKYIVFRLLVDFATGDATYIIGVSDEYVNGFRLEDSCTDEQYDIRIIMTQSFKLAVDIPISYSNVNEQNRNMLLQGIKGVAAVFTQGASLKGGTTSSDVTREIKRVNPDTGRYRNDMKITETTKQSYTPSTSQYVAGAVNSAVAGSVNVLNNMGVSTSSSNIGSANMLMNCSNDILIIVQRANVVEQSADFYRLKGRPLGEVKSLGSVSGYVKASNVYLDNNLFKTATQEEMAMLTQELIQGIYLP